MLKHLFDISTGFRYKKMEKSSPSIYRDGSPVKQLSLKQLPFKKANSKTANSKSANFKTATL